MSKGEVESLLSAQKIKTEELKKRNILIPPVFVYISYKAAVFCVVGAVIYQKDDFFHYPLEEWNEENIKKGNARAFAGLKWKEKERQSMYLQ